MIITLPIKLGVGAKVPLPVIYFSCIIQPHSVLHFKRDAINLVTCGTTGIEAILLQAQFRWVGHVIIMPDLRVPKQVFFGQLSTGCRLQGGPVRRYKDGLKANLRACSIDPKALRSAPCQKSSWRKECKVAISNFELRRTGALVAKRQTRKAATSQSSSLWVCDVCARHRASRIGLFAHRKTHR